MVPTLSWEKFCYYSNLLNHEISRSNFMAILYNILVHIS